MSGAHRTRIRAIVAVAENWAIGRDGDIPWHYGDDLRFVKRTTTGHALVMGRKTYDSIGRPLRGRTNIVLSRSRETGTDEQGVVWISDPARAIEIAREQGRDLFVFGGAGIFELYADRIQEWIVTRVPETAEEADTFLDPSLLEGWAVVEREEIGSGLIVEYYRRDGALEE